MNDKERKIYLTMIKNGTIKTLLGLDEAGPSSSSLYDERVFDEEYMKELAAHFAKEMAKELEMEEIEEYCDFISSPSYSKIYRAQSSGVIAFLKELFQEKFREVGLNFPKTSESSEKKKIVYEAEGGDDVAPSFSYDDDGFIGVHDLDFDPDKVN